MVRGTRLVLFAGALALGGFAGAAAASTTYTTGANSETPPLMRPLIGAFASVVTIGQADTVGRVQIGRDNLSPWAAVEAQLATAQGSLSQNTTYAFVYRPLWDVFGLPNRPSFPESEFFSAQWTACDVFARNVTTMRANMGPQGIGIVMYLDLNSSQVPSYLEFYKYEMSW